MPRPKHLVNLTSDEREHLLGMVQSGSTSAHIQRHARMLRKADWSAEGPAWNDGALVTARDGRRPAVEQVRRTCAPRPGVRTPGRGRQGARNGAPDAEKNERKPG